MLQTKLAHVQYTTEKAIRYYLMVAAAENNIEAATTTTLTVNRMYSLRSRLSRKSEKMSGREKRYALKVVMLLDELISDAEAMSRNILLYSGMMRGATDSLLMTILKAVHYQYREQVYMAVMDRTAPFPSDDETRCLLGWWYHHDGMKKFSNLPVFIRLGDAHSQLHRSAADLAMAVRQGEDTGKLLIRLDVFESDSQS
ncbi:hypothetical protein E1K64_24195, partial [Salmonella enterica subsp. enterica serovar Poona]|nr:hypothetical protein [Salmonella enterica subsp. enterica serovar Poona]